ncbi:MAG: hypothetical protein GX897_06725 [Clostridiales bacterium]|nr:hypothetical protein [Clostridiales bacterium]
MINYIIVLFSVILLALQFSATKFYQLKYGAGAVSATRFNVIVRGITSLVFLSASLISLGRLGFSGVSVLYAALIALFCVTYTLLGFIIMKLGPVSVYMMFLMSGGMLLPWLFGVFYLDEPANAARIVGLVLMLVSLLLPLLDSRTEGQTKKIKGSYWVLCAFVFLLNGGVSIFSKLHQVSAAETVETIEFVFLANLCNFIISGTALAVSLLRGKKNPPEAPTEPTDKNYIGKTLKPTLTLMIPVCAVTAVLDGSAYFLQLLGAARLDASVLYPMVTGGTIVLSAVAARIFFGEKPGRYSLAGLALSFAATFLFLAA